MLIRVNIDELGVGTLGKSFGYTYVAKSRFFGFLIVDRWRSCGDV